jgi:D-glycero-D-manno-heptose 1,7-bisphosphate phosphatase
MNNLRKAIFLDRDGVINKNRSDYVKTVDELEILDVGNAIKKLKENNFLVVVISNQSAINRGLTSHENVKKIHFKIQDYLKNKGTTIDAFYYCPHRPDENCDCRKPKPGLFEKATHELNIDILSSWMIGDRDSDIEAASQIGCKSIKIFENDEINSVVEGILNSKESI